MPVLSHRIRLYPNQGAASYFRQACGTSRFAYNWALARWKERYAEGETTTGYALVKEFNTLKGASFPWTADVTKWAPQKAIQDLGEAFGRFFKGTSRHPRFKAKGRSRDSFYVAGAHVRVGGKRVRVPKLGWVRMAQTVRFPGRVLSVTVSREADRWFASFAVDVDETAWVYPHRCESQAVGGVDVGVSSLGVDSDGTVFNNPRALRRLETKLKRANRELARKVRGSSNWHKAKVPLTRLHARIRNVRQTASHAMTAYLVRTFRTLGIEDLNVAGMLKNHCLAKAISDAAFGEIRRQLTYKAALAGCDIVVVDRWYPSSKTCSACGARVESLPLPVRHWTCACGVTHDRDHNAAKNLRAVAQSAWETQNACGEDVSPSELRPRQQTSVKQEAGTRPQASA